MMEGNKKRNQKRKEIKKREGKIIKK